MLQSKASKTVRSRLKISTVTTPICLSLQATNSCRKSKRARNSLRNNRTKYPSGPANKRSNESNWPKRPQRDVERRIGQVEAQAGALGTMESSSPQVCDQ